MGSSGPTPGPIGPVVGPAGPTLARLGSGLAECCRLVPLVILALSDSRVTWQRGVFPPTLVLRYTLFKDKNESKCGFHQGKITGEPTLFYSIHLAYYIGMKEINEIKFEIKIYARDKLK